MNLRYLWRSVLSVFVLWFALSPTLCYASEVVTGSSIDYNVPSTLDYTEDSPANGMLSLTSRMFYFDSSWARHYNKDVYLTDAGSNYTNEVAYSGTFLSNMQSYSYFASSHIYRMQDNTKFVSAGDSFNLQLTGLYNSYREHGPYGVSSGSGGSTYYTDYTFKTGYLILEDSLKYIKLYLIGSDGVNTLYKQVNVDDVLDYVTQNSDYTFTFEMNINDVPFDVYGLNIQFIYDNSWISPSGIYGYEDGGRYLDLNNGYKNHTFTLTLPDDTSGFLSSIIEWLRSIRDGIVNVKDGVTNVFNAITELPSKIWNLIESGLKSLFVPSQDDITQMSDDWNNLMRDRFGALYESADIVHDFAETLQNGSTESGGVITMPETTVNLVGVNYTFGGFDVDLIPNGFEFLANSIKTIISIICTIAFINALKTKLEGLMK